MVIVDLKCFNLDLFNVVCDNPDFFTILKHYKNELTVILLLVANCS